MGTCGGAWSGAFRGMWKGVPMKKCTKREGTLDVHDSGSGGGQGWSHQNPETTEKARKREGGMPRGEIASRSGVDGVGDCKNSREAKRKYFLSILRIMKPNPGKSTKFNKGKISYHVCQRNREVLVVSAFAEEAVILTEEYVEIENGQDRGALVEFETEESSEEKNWGSYRF